MDAGTSHSGHWGPVTATLDWCEVRRSFPSSANLTSPFHVRQANYQFSHYVAEISNTFSNLFFVCISLYGASLSLKQSLPARYLVGFAVRPRHL
jgi:dihydroceramidase